MARHSFSGASVGTTLSSSINSSVTAIPVNTLTGTWPNTVTGPFVVTIDRGTATEEKILVSSYTATQLTATRGYDGTTAVSHANGANVEHTLDATQIDLHDSVVAGVGTVPPSTSAVGDAAADGTAVTAPAAGDHKHGREAFGAAATASAPGDAEGAGSASTPSRSDHQHGREAFGTSSTTSAVGDAEGAGSAATVARSDHLHGRESFSASAPSADGAGSAGSSASPARADHTHPFSTRLIEALTLIGATAGTVGATNFMIQAGTAVVTTDSTGNFSISFPTSFPGGVVVVLATPGDTANQLGMVIVVQSGVSTSGFAGVAMTFAGGYMINKGCRINYVAIGF